MMPAHRDGSIRLTIRSTPTDLPKVRTEVESLCRTLGFPQEVAGHVMLSVDEALTNIIRHAYGGSEDRPIDIELAPLFENSAPTGLRIRLRDYGQRVDLARIRPRELHDVRPGGLGVHIIRECMDVAEYAHAEDGGTVLTLIKYLPPCKQDDPP